MEGQKLLGWLWLLSSVFFLTKCVRNDTRRRRRQSCPDGTYKTSAKIECCLCAKGHYLVQDCTLNLSNPTCEVCQNGTFQDHVTHERSCEPCKRCGSTENMMEEQNCTASSNTVCRCLDGHYCDKGDECKVCYACSTCEFGVKVPCSLTSDTQCNEGSNLPPAVIPIIVITPIIIIIIALTVAFVLWRKKLLCFKPPQKSENSKLLEPLNDPDLQEMLPKIAEILGFRVVRSVVRRQAVLSQAAIDNIMDENPRDAGERAYQLLKAWYEKHGMKGASTALCDNLIGINMRSKAEVVHKLIKDEVTRRELETNGNV